MGVTCYPNLCNGISHTSFMGTNADTSWRDTIALTTFWNTDFGSAVHMCLSLIFATSGSKARSYFFGLMLFQLYFNYKLLLIIFTFSCVSGQDQPILCQKQVTSPFETSELVSFLTNCAETSYDVITDFIMNKILPRQRVKLIKKIGLVFRSFLSHMSTVNFHEYNTRNMVMWRLHFAKCLFNYIH